MTEVKRDVRHRNGLIIYGTGKLAKEFCVGTHRDRIIACLDGYRLNGSFIGIPIITWDEVEALEAEAVVMCVAIKNQKEVYERIHYKCDFFGLDVFDIYGNDLKDIYRDQFISIRDFDYMNRSYDDLINEIDNVDCVSFDLFDTIIMRRTLYPEDTFIKVEECLEEEGIQCEGFVKKRLIAEREVGGINYHAVYDKLKDISGLSSSQISRIKDIEISVEADNLIPRHSIVRAMEYAKNEGKHVNIVSDMYYSAEELKYFLDKLAITAYDNIFVSSDYGVAKSQGLFKEYKEKVEGKGYLHIGDDIHSDVYAAEREGITPFQIKSARDLLRISSIRGCMKFEMNVAARMYIGIMLSELFNDPFCLYKSSGMVQIKSFSEFIAVFFSPLVISFVQLVNSCVTDRYNAILFVARDGWLFKKIYDKLWPDSIPTKYFLSSRKAAYSVWMPDDTDRKKLKNHLVHRGYEDVDQMVNELALSDTEKYINKSKDFYSFLKKNQISTTCRYLFCDLASAGSTQYALNRGYFNDCLDAVYLYKENGVFGERRGDRALLSIKEWYHLAQYNILFEKVFTSSEASVAGYSEGGEVLFSEDDRADSEIEEINEIHDAIVKKCSDFYAKSKYKMEIDFAVYMMELMAGSVYNSTWQAMDSFSLIDDLDRTRTVISERN